MTSQIYESYLPIYDTVPEKWEEARPFFVEQLKKISEAVNTREIGYFQETQIITGKQFPKLNGPEEFRTVFRKVIDSGALIAGVNPPIAHGITYNNQFTLVDLWVAATNSVGLTSRLITGNDVTLNATNVNITSPAAFDRSWVIIEYLLEV